MTSVAARDSGTCHGCRCALAPDRRVALPVDGRKAWFCPACLTGRLAGGRKSGVARAVAYSAMVLAVVVAGAMPANAEIPGDPPPAPPIESSTTVAEPATEAPAPAEAAPAQPDGPAKPERIGASACLACHSKQESFHDTIHARAWPRAKKIEAEQSCETCHGPGSLHAAAAGDRLDAGFATIRGPKAFKTAEGSQACLTCHVGSGRMHWKGSVHESRNVGCASCHDTHAGRKKLLTKDTELETCTTCHSNVKSEIRRMSHHPIVEGKVTCSDCHNAHGTVGKKLLVGNSVNETCFKCHTEKRGPHLWEHKPVTEGCTTCHQPHGSVHHKLVKTRLPYLCQSCHSASNHPGTMYAMNPTTPGKLPGQKLNNRTLYRACLDCHANIHGSNHPSGKTFTR